MSDKAIISIREVSYLYDHSPVLDRVSLDVIDGDYLGIIGPNGGGKTTLVKLILGLLTPASGTIELFGEPVGSFKDWSRIGYVPQKAAHAESRFPFTVEEVVSLGRVPNRGLLRRLGPADRKAVSEAMEQVHVSPLRKRLITELSGGQQQRVFIAKGLVSGPKVLILDEPTAGVDVQSQDEFYHMLHGLNEEHGITLVLVSHDIDVIANEVTSIACVNQTLVCHVGPQEFIKGDYLEKLYGQSRKFILHGH